jgi:hypothetical protein
MRYDFYNSKEYREKQSAIMKENWRKVFLIFATKERKEPVQGMDVIKLLKLLFLTQKFIVVKVVQLKLITKGESLHLKRQN